MSKKKSQKLPKRSEMKRQTDRASNVEMKKLQTEFVTKRGQAKGIKYVELPYYSGFHSSEDFVRRKLQGLVNGALRDSPVRKLNKAKFHDREETEFNKRFWVSSKLRKYKGEIPFLVSIKRQMQFKCLTDAQVNAVYKSMKNTLDKRAKEHKERQEKQCQDKKNLRKSGTKRIEKQGKKKRAQKAKSSFKKKTTD